MTAQKLQDDLTQLRRLAEQIACNAEALASQQHDPHASDTLRSIGEGSHFMAAQVQAMQQALSRL